MAKAQGKPSRTARTDADIARAAALFGQALAGALALNCDGYQRENIPADHLEMLISNGRQKAADTLFNDLVATPGLDPDMVALRYIAVLQAHGLDNAADEIFERFPATTNPLGILLPGR